MELILKTPIFFNLLCNKMFKIRKKQINCTDNKLKKD